MRRVSIENYETYQKAKQRSYEIYGRVRLCILGATMMLKLNIWATHKLLKSTSGVLFCLILDKHGMVTCEVEEVTVSLIVIHYFYSPASERISVSRVMFKAVKSIF